MKKLAVALLLMALPAHAAAQPRAADGTPEDVDISTVAQPATPAPGSLDSSKIRLDAQDAAGALSDAEIALSKGGGADAYAARADAKRALGRPIDEAIADYAQAAKLDPRYIEKWKGLIAQKASEEHPTAKGDSGSKGLNGVPVSTIATAAIIGGMLIAAAVRMLRSRSEHPVAPDDDNPSPQESPKEPPKPA